MKAFYHITKDDLANDVLLKRLSEFTVIVCSADVDPNMLRAHTKAKLLSTESCIHIPHWGETDPYWKDYRAQFGEERLYFHDLVGGDRSSSKEEVGWKAWLHKPILEIADRKIDWFSDRLASFDGMYLDMATRGYSPNMPSWGFPIRQDELVYWHHAQAGFVDYFIKQFRLRRPTHFLVANSQGPSQAKWNATVHLRNWRFPDETLRCLSGISIEKPTIQDMGYFQKAMEIGSQYSIGWYAPWSSPGLVMPGEMKS